MKIKEIDLRQPGSEGQLIGLPYDQLNVENFQLYPRDVENKDAARFPKVLEDARNAYGIDKPNLRG